MTTVILVRHGENEYVAKGRFAGRLPGVHLNDKGRQEAAITAEKLSTLPIKAVYSSPMDRTRETAAPIAEYHGLDVIIREGLNEIDLGDWEDKTLKDCRRRKLWETIQNNPSRAGFPNGETFADAQIRIVNEIEALLQLHKAKDVIVVVGHSDMIKLLIAYYTGLHLDLFQRLIISPASISTLMFGENLTKLVNMNLIPVLPKEK